MTRPTDLHAMHVACISEHEDGVLLQFDPRKPTTLWLLSFVTSFVLYGYLIPISLYVSLEMVKVVQSMVLINQDRTMYHAASDTPAKV